MKNWKNEVLSEKLTERNGVFISDFKKTNGIFFHEKMKYGASLREFQSKSFHLSYWETPYYKKTIENFLEDVLDRDESVIMDIGCGDGRFTEQLVEIGFNKIVATDSDIRPLYSLARYSKERGFQDKILIINCDAQKIPVLSSIAKAAIAIGVFYYMNENFDIAIKESYRILDSTGVLINSEPDLEGAIYKSIIFENLDDVLENFNNKRFKEEKGATDFKFKLFDDREITSLLSSNGFKVEKYHGISLLPSILRIKMVRDEIKEEDIKRYEEQIWRLFNYLDISGKLYKHIIWKSRK